MLAQKYRVLKKLADIAAPTKPTGTDGTPGQPAAQQTGPNGENGEWKPAKTYSSPKEEQLATAAKEHSQAAMAAKKTEMLRLKHVEQSQQAAQQANQALTTSVSASTAQGTGTPSQISAYQKLQLTKQQPMAGAAAKTGIGNPAAPLSAGLQEAQSKGRFAALTQKLAAAQYGPGAAANPNMMPVQDSPKNMDRAMNLTSSPLGWAGSDAMGAVRSKMQSYGMKPVHGSYGNPAQQAAAPAQAPVQQAKWDSSKQWTPAMADSAQLAARRTQAGESYMNVASAVNTSPFSGVRNYLAPIHGASWDSSKQWSPPTRHGVAGSTTREQRPSPTDLGTTNISATTDLGTQNIHAEAQKHVDTPQELRAKANRARMQALAARNQATAAREQASYPEGRGNFVPNNGGSLAEQLASNKAQSTPNPFKAGLPTQQNVQAPAATPTPSGPGNSGLPRVGNSGNSPLDQIQQPMSNTSDALAQFRRQPIQTAAPQPPALAQGVVPLQNKMPEPAPGGLAQRMQRIPPQPLGAGGAPTQSAEY